MQSNPHLVTPGDVYVHHEGLTDEDQVAAVSVALEQGAVLVVAPHLPKDSTGLHVGEDPLEGVVPDEVPLVRVKDSTEAGSRLAAAFYGAWHCCWGAGRWNMVGDVWTQSCGTYCTSW